MKGLTPQQLLEITEFVQAHHKFGYVREEDRINGQPGHCIKYIDACYDTRQGDYWAITFRGMGSISFHTNAFGFSDNPKDMQHNNLYDWVMDFLKYKWEPKGKQYDFMYRDKEGPLHNPFPDGTAALDWSDFDMIEAYCADLEDRNSADMADACKWIIDYRDKKQKLSK